VNINRIPIRTWLLVLILALAPTASAEWKEKVLYSFQGGTDGSTPAGGVVFDTAGNLYGATEQGGGSDCKPISWCGTVFQLKPPAKQGDPWTETVLHAFAGVTSTGHDGAVPAGGLVIDAPGNLYGTTAYGGSGDCVLAGIKGGCGTVFELEPPKTKGGSWTYKTLYSFQGGKDGYFPWGDLVFDNAGNLYGATQFGGGFGTCDSPYYQFCGTVFELSPPKTKGGTWKENVLYSFKSGKDGANPTGGLIFDGKGAIYGTTSWGGSTTNCVDGGFVGCGTGFELVPPGKKGGAWSEQVLHRFKAGTGDGQGPNGGLIFDSSGHLYGTTRGGGNAEAGVVFRLAAVSGTRRWAETIPYSFKGGTQGWVPDGGLILDTSGYLYGTTNVATTQIQGTVFRLKPSISGHSSNFTTLYGFRGSPDGAQPASDLRFDKMGKIYGTTQGGGTAQACLGGCGTVFDLGP
jgi:uncharacterized repeat protein (TIGR03803 family)